MAQIKLVSRTLTCTLLVAFAVVTANAQDFTNYQRVAQLQGILTVVGSTTTAHVVRVWGKAFLNLYPEVMVRVVATGSSRAPQAMIDDAHVIGMMSRPMKDEERAELTNKRGLPLELKVAVDAVGIYVFKDNPLSSISLSDIERIFSAHPRSGDRIVTWGQLGLKDDWASRPIMAFGYHRGHGINEVMSQLALNGAEFHPGLHEEPVSTSVVQGVGVEYGGIGYASLYYRTARTKVLPIRVDDETIAPTDETIGEGNYPLARYLYLYFLADATSPPHGGGKNSLAHLYKYFFADDATSTPNVEREFLRFVLSRQGQDLVGNAGESPISAALAVAQRATLEK
jgi:phosphate transport system substrate-binding protein